MSGREVASAVSDEARARATADAVGVERIVADLSARVANASHESIVSEIEAGLGRLVESLGYDRCTYTEFAADGTLSVVCSAAIRGIEPLSRGPFGPKVPWIISELRAGRIVALADLPDDLPPQARADAERFGRIGLRSHLAIPLRVGGRVAGALSFGGIRNAPSWPEDVVTRLKIIGEIFAIAIARARSEEETQLLRSRLWHADRVARTGALTAAIAHELNQPLTAILSNAQAGLAYLQQGEGKLQEVRAVLESVVRDDKRAAETIRTMRALLRQDESGRERIDLAAALREVLQLLARELHRQGIRIESELETGCSVMADKVQIEQVALNLVLNAAAAMDARPRNDRLLQLSVTRTDNDRVVVAVCDSGTGIAAEHLDAVFEPFWTTRRDGLGLGLAICRSIVQAHGGAISAGPNPDRGVTFRIELPLAASDRDSEEAGASPEGATLEASAVAGVPEPTVCVVEDDPAVRKSLTRLLAAAGWKAAPYASASEFLARPSLASIACVLLDIQMPGMSGLELQEHLSSKGTAPPIVFLTGQDDVAAGVDAMKLGAVDFLVKPVDDDVLLAVVRKAVQRHAGERKQALEREACRGLLGRLTAREREIVEHVIRGRLNKQIAADLDIAEQTVKQHRGRVMEKLEVRSVAELIRLCERSELFATQARPVSQPRAA